MAVRTGRGRSLLFAAACVACLVAAGAASARAGTVHFVVAERPGTPGALGDSYILPLSAAADVAHARDLIARGPEVAESAIVFATVAAGADGINRNVLAAGEPLWNWHVSAFEGFGDIGIELTDGNPTQVGDDVQGWIRNTRTLPEDNVGHIGFWTYTVVAEVSESPVSVPLPPGGATAAIGLIAIVVASLRPWSLWRRVP